MTELQVTINNLKEVCIAAEMVLEKLKKAQKDLETPPPHVWKHGDIFKTRTNNIMVYLKFTTKPPQTVCIVGDCGGLVQRKHFNNVLHNAKFLFNIKEKL